MIVFHSVKWRNFLSYGDYDTEIRLDSHKSTLIVGHNGAGKSTMLDALSFALFGRAHRNINKNQLVNSINQKGCAVEVQFTVNGARFKIIRGIKPNKFEIWKGDTMLNQDSNAREYQKILEQNILKLNHKSFHQIVVLGSSSFIPFMQLTNNARREVIEDLLDINVFSKMNMLLREQNSRLKDQLVDVAHIIDMKNQAINSQKKYISELNKLNKQQRDQKQQRIKEIQADIRDLTSDNDALRQKIDAQIAIFPTRISKLEKKKEQLIKYETTFNGEIKTVVKTAKFFESNTTCPTCTQSIDDAFRQSKMEASTSKARELNSAMKRLQDEKKVVDKDLKDAVDMMEKIRKWQNQFHANSQTQQRLNKDVDALIEEIDQIGAGTADTTQAEKELAEAIVIKEQKVEEKLKFNEQIRYNSVIGEMLKDTGIKTKIVKQYLPVINKLVNQYLQVLDFFVSFHLDESFTETIKSRHRDAFTYDSFSEGEKQRIDLALLFTWRMVAKMKNSVATNLLVLDETFDSSLDFEGIDNLMKILYTLDEHTNTFIISHKGDILDGKFASKIEFHKEKDFSRIKS